MNILGLDLSLTGTGLCMPNGRTTTIKRPSDAGDRRLLDIANAVTAVHTTDCITGGRLHLVVIEGLYEQAHGSSRTAMVHGAVRLELIRADVPYAIIAPATLKAYATGKGTANKTDMAMAAYKRATLEFADDNQCDAWWLRQAGLDWFGRAEITLPEAQRARLEKVKWPSLPGHHLERNVS